MTPRKLLALLGLAFLAPLTMAPTPTTGRHYGAPSPHSLSVGWKTATVNDDIYVKITQATITPVALDCVATGATVPSAFVVTFDECDSNATNCASMEGTVTLTALVTNTQDATFSSSNTSVAVGNWVRFDVTSLTTAPDYAYCRLWYTR